MPLPRPAWVPAQGSIWVGPGWRLWSCRPRPRSGAGWAGVNEISEVISLKTDTLTRIAGIAMIPGSLLAAIGLTAQTVHVAEAAGGGAELAGGLMLILALPALGIRMATQAGILGLLGAVLVTLVILDFQSHRGRSGRLCPAFPRIASHPARPDAGRPRPDVPRRGGGPSPWPALLAFTTIRYRPLPSIVGWCWAASVVAAVASFAPGVGVFATISGVLAYTGFVLAGLSLAQLGARKHAEAPRAATMA